MNLYKSFIYAVLVLGSLTNLYAGAIQPLIRNLNSKYKSTLVYADGRMGYGVSRERLSQLLLKLWGEEKIDLIEQIVNAQSAEERRNLIVLGDVYIRDLAGVQKEAYRAIRNELRPRPAVAPKPVQMPMAGAGVNAPAPPKRGLPFIDEDTLEQEFGRRREEREKAASTIQSRFRRMKEGGRLAQAHRDIQDVKAYDDWKVRDYDRNTKAADYAQAKLEWRETQKNVRKGLFERERKFQARLYKQMLNDLKDRFPAEVAAEEEMSGE